MAIPTLYQGIEYRSRLEAKWASFFHRMGWEFEYEPFDGDGYIPDFLIYGVSPIVVEVKPAVTWANYVAAFPKIEKGLWEHWKNRVWIVGTSPLPKLRGDFETLPVAGALFESWWVDDELEPLVWDTSGDESNIAYWSADPREGVFSELGSWHRSPGKEDAVHKPWYAVPEDVEIYHHSTHVIKKTWAAATNDVKWRGRDV